MKNFLLLFVLIGIWACNNSSKTSVDPGLETISEKADSLPVDLRHRIANAAGVEQWGKVSEIAFTFNVDRGDNHSERSWVWRPKTQDVKMITSQGTVSYNRSHMDSITEKTDAAFINDKYWLFAPFQLVWDSGTTMTAKENVVSPISKDTLDLLTIVYPDTGGYTPGDAYDLFYNKDYQIKEWNYRRGNDPQPTLSTTWEEYKDFDGIKIATVHKDSTGNFKLYFSDILIDFE